MSFVFRFEQVERTDQETILTGRMLRGESSWPKRVVIQAEEETKTVYSAPLRGIALVGLDDQQVSVLTDFASWERNFEFPRPTTAALQFRLILHGAAPADLPVPGLAWAADAKSPVPPDLATAIQSRPGPGDEFRRGTPQSGSTSAPLAPRPTSLGTPLREYPYQVNRWRIFLIAPWFMFLTMTILLGVGMVAFWKWAHVDLVKWSAFALFGLVDVFMLYLSIRMLFTPRSQIIVTATGISLPVFISDFSSDNVFLPFADIYAMLEYWHKSSVRLIKLDTHTGSYVVNVFLMQTSHFEELRRILWQRTHETLTYKNSPPYEFP
jgi:hypothetical protein